MVVTAKLASYRMSHQRTIPGAEHKHIEQIGWSTPTTGPSAQTSGEEVQRSWSSAAILSAFTAISPHFRPHRHRLRPDAYRCEVADRCSTWNGVTGVAAAA
jgi:putative transposase